VTDATGEVDAVKTALLPPAATVTDAGTVAAAVLLLDSATTTPPAGAGPVSDTVPAEPVEPVTLVGLRLTEFSAGGATVRMAVGLDPPYAAVSVTGVEEATAVVLTVNEALVPPCGTVTEAGTVAAALLLLKLTTAPPAGACPPSVTVAVDGLPPVTVAGLTLRVPAVGGVTVRVAGSVVPP
jgi:hypothetical protein